MGSSSKKSKDKEKDSRKRRHRSPEDDAPDYSKEKRHKHHKRHHKERKRDKETPRDYKSDDSDVVEIIPDEAPPPPRRRSPVEQNKSTDTLSIEETNKLRAKLGLKPLEVGTSTVKQSSSSSSQRHRETNKDLRGLPENAKKKDDLGEFYHKPAENLIAKAKSEKIRQKLVERKEKRERESKLSKVKLLGVSDEEDDVTSWVDKNRQIEIAKKEAEKRAKMLEELDAQFGVSDVIESEEREKRRQQYTEKNLRGLKVDHDVDTFAEEKNVILTLKDSGVLDDDDDVLVNVNMLDDERYKKSNDNKKKKALYNPYEDQEFDEFGNPKEKSLLSKYDEELNGAQKEGFKIGYDAAIERKLAATQSIKEKLAKKTLESIAETKLKLASEYYNDEELAKFKKPKKKIRKIRQKGKLFTADDLEKSATGLEHIGSRRPKKSEFDIDDVPDVPMPTNIKFEEEKDDLLEKALHKARKIRQKENVAAELIHNFPMKTEIKEEPLDSGNITLNSTAEFCRTLGDIPTYGRAGNRDEAEEMDMDVDNDIKPDEESEEEPDCQIIEPSDSGWSMIDPSDSGKHHKNEHHEVQILDEEPDVSKGMAAALKLAMSKGYLDKDSDNKPSNSRLAYLQAKHYSIEDKVYGEENERGGGRRERYSGPIQDFKEKESFKPNVKLEYIDDDGHILNSKEAFRYLSHKFHGKGPGKNKVEKRIKKSVQEQLMKKMSSTDTPLGTLNMLQSKQKETQSPFVILSGNKQSQSTIISKTSRN